MNGPSKRNNLYPAYHMDPEATGHDLLNEATEWLQYAKGLTGLLADLVHEADIVNCKKLALGLDAIGALVHLGVQCAAEAHVRLLWNTSRPMAADSDA